jgi:hypothetical protein
MVKSVMAEVDMALGEGGTEVSLNNSSKMAMQI